MNTRASVELVPPDGGYAMSSPRWSPNGRYLAFQEITGYEGSGFFAYYDFETDTYHRWEDRIGLLTWSADSTQIAYDRLTYTATGEERIFIRDLTGGEEQLVTSGITSGYAFAPAISPLGDRIAYFTHDGVRDFEVYTLYIRMLSNGETIEIGEFSNIQQPEWSSDGSLLTLSSGTYGTQQVITVSVEDGSFSVVAEGSIPTIAAISQ
jgi:Tol biopolymer transport system component